jgi:hypothetical protein
MRKLHACLLFFLLSFVPGAVLAAVEVPTDIQQPGTQPGEIGNLESPGKCDNCHGGYNSSVEPAHNWRGSMMAHAGRDPIFWATVAIAEQDFDGAGDLCIRCHSTGGWLAGRSTPTDGSGLAAGDSDGVECDFCHKLTNPDDTEHLGTMTFPFVANEPTPNNDLLFDWDAPVFGEDGVEGYLGSGMASMWAGSDKLGPYDNAEARHQFMESKFHRDRDFCGTCHDVSNPAVGDLAHNNGAQPTADPVTADGTPGSPVNGKAAFNNPPYKYGVVERTFSEYKAGQISRTLVSDYPTLPADLQGGALEAMYNAATQNGATDGNYQNPPAPRYFSCQTCHMRPVTGKGANKNGVPTRVDLPLHDMTGGNYWMPEAIAYLNGEGKLRLGGGMSQGAIDAMLDGALRAKEQLSLAATLSISGNGNSVKIVNHTGHKLISGYPEGRRMWLNIKWYDSAGTLIREDGAYGPLTDSNDVEVTVPNPAGGPDVQVESILDLNDPNTKIYEAHMGMTKEWASQLLGLGYDPNLVLSYDRLSGQTDLTLGELAGSDPGTQHETFHFVLNNTVVEDNRIPPYGMSYELARVRNALPVPASQYGGAPGGTYSYFDEVALNPPAGAQSAAINLKYQPTSWEYIQFLDLANNTPAGSFLADEGKNMLEAWLNTGMAKPYTMASVTWGTPPGECNATTPVLLNANPADKQVSLNWQEIPGDPDVAGYKLYYDQAGKAQLVADLQCPPEPTEPQEACTSFTDIGLTNGEEYCYKVTSYSSACESDFSNILCAIPTQPGQELLAGVDDPMQTGKWVTTGKGKNQTTTFVITGDFVRGDGVVLRAEVKNEGGLPISGATVTIAISGPESAELTTGPSDANGVAEATWNTQSPNKKGSGGTASGGYTATTTGVTASGFVWDQIPTSTTFTISQ